MAFCNSCGATLTPGTKFCNKCGAPSGMTTSAAPAAPPTPAPPAAPKGGSSALKIVLIVIAVIVVIGILGIATVGIIGYRIAKSSHVTQQGDKVKLETPLGTINDPEQAVKDLGVEVYPGAEVQKAGSADVTIFGVHTVTANFTSADSADKICDFYKSKFPAANVKSSDENHCTMVSEDPKNVVTINVQASGDATRFQIASVTKKGASSN